MSVTVTMAHVRAERLCARGVRQWFAQHDLDWQRFRREGLPAEDFERTGDALALRVAARARGEVGQA